MPAAPGNSGHAMKTIAFKKSAKRYAARHSIALSQAQEDLAQILGFKNLHAALLRFAKNDKPSSAVRTDGTPHVEDTDGEHLFQQLGRNLLNLELQMGTDPSQAKEVVDDFLWANVTRYPSKPVVPRNATQVKRLIEEVLLALSSKRKALVSA